MMRKTKHTADAIPTRGRSLRHRAGFGEEIKWRTAALQNAAVSEVELQQLYEATRAELGDSPVQAIPFDTVVRDLGWSKKTWLREEINFNRAVPLPPRYRVSSQKWIILRRDLDDFLISIVSVQRAIGESIGFRESSTYGNEDHLAQAPETKIRVEAPHQNRASIGKIKKPEGDGS
jgi:hypothetical protein